MASSFDSFNPEGYQNDPTKQHVQHDYDGCIGDDTSFPGATEPLAQENFSNDNNMHSSEVSGFGMPSPSLEFASTFGFEVFETNGGDGGGGDGGGGDGFFVSDGPLLPEPDEMFETKILFLRHCQFTESQVFS
jgi:hypothetical protein